MPSALTDARDTGRYFARLVRDERTVDKYVLVYNEMWTQHQIWDAVSRIAGEEVPKAYTSAAELEKAIEEAKAALAAGDPDGLAAFRLVGAQYPYSWAVRGDNTPEYAKYLGYVTSKELYPDMEFVGFEEYFRGIMEGSARPAYEERRAEIQEAFKAANKA